MNGTNLFLELYGSNLTPNLLVFFSTIPTMTFYRSSELIFCLVPSFRQFVSSTNPMPIFDIPLYLWKKDGILYQTEHRYVYFLAEHIAIDHRNQANSSHSSVTMQPDLLNGYKISNDIGTETNDFLTNGLYVAKNEFETNGGTSDYQLDTNRMTFQQTAFQTGTNNISVSSDTVCPTNTFGTETNLSLADNSFRIQDNISSHNFSFPLSSNNGAFSDTCFGTETNSVYINSYIHAETVPMTTEQSGTNSCTYLSDNFPNNTIGFTSQLIGNFPNTPDMSNTAFGTETSEYTEELEPNIHPFDGTVPLNYSLLQTGTDSTRKRRIGTNESVALKLCRLDDTMFPDTHYTLKTETSNKD